MNITLFDDIKRKQLLPLVFTRPCALLRIGIFTIADKWGNALDALVKFDTEAYLSAKFPNHSEAALLINGRILPTYELIDFIKNDFKSGTIKDVDGTLIAQHPIEGPEVIWNKEVSWVNRPFDIFSLNAGEIEKDISWISNQRKSIAIPSTVKHTGKHPIFIEEGAVLGFCYLNTEEGPIYIGKNSTIMDGSMVRGSFALCAHSTLKMGAKIYGGTTIGPHSKVGGEVNNSVFQGYSNKGHDGFLGNSVLGEWCNLGADTNNSNLKNNYDEVKLWNYDSNRFEKSGKQFCGLIMGDHSKCGINTMFNTGTVVGVSANIFGSGFPRNFIPSFAWGGNNGFMTYLINKSLETAKIVFSRRGLTLDIIEENILEHIYNETQVYRNWEK